MASLLTRLPLALPLACLLTLAGCASNTSGTHAQQKMTTVLASADDAAKAYDSGDMAKAASLYDEVVKSMPDDAETWFRLGNARYRLQQPDDAVVAYQHALQLNPTHARAWHNLGVIRLKQAQAAMTASSQAAPDNDPLRASSAETAERIAGIDRADRQPSPAAAVPASPASPASPAASPSPAGTVTMPADTSAEASPHRSATVTVIPLGSKSP
jgi:tetratricopeptide (TPR) repeat protein